MSDVKPSAKQEITLARIDDWVVFYLNGEKKYENHNMDPEEMLDILGIEYQSYFVDLYDVPNNLINEGFPDTLDKAFLKKLRKMSEQK